MRSLLILVLIINSTLGSSQIFEDMEIDGERIIPWIEEDPEGYEGVYFFGISEQSLEVKDFNPYNPLTGKDIEIPEQLGRLLINMEGRTKVIPNLYTITELKELIGKYNHKKCD